MKKRKVRFKDPSILCFTLFFLVICIVYWSIAIFNNVRGVNIKNFANNRNTYSTTLYAKRGSIYDNDGNTLALNVSSYTVIAYLSSSRTTDIDKPNHVVDKENTASLLAPLLNMSYGYLVSLLNTQDVYQVELGPGGRGISTLLKEQIEDLNLPGIDFIESSKRFYPNGNFASYIVGYAKTNENYDDNHKIVQSIDGELGIEALYDDKLKGTNGFLSYEQDGNGYKIPDTKEHLVKAQNGNDVYLTINSSIQRFVEDAVSEAYKEYDPEWILFYVMDAKTGDILAGTSYPSFDPNKLDLTNYENPLVSYSYEPGSVMKVYTYMCAVEKGTYKGDLTYESGNIEIEGTKIFDWNRVGWGTITYDLGLEYSSNVGAVNVVKNFLSKEELHDCFTNYGFGSKTGIEMPRELPGTLNFKYPIEVASASYGQGITTTPIQQLQALSIIANNGKMLKPHIIKKIVDTDTNEELYTRKIEESANIVSQETVNKMKQLMWNVVNGDNGNNTTGEPFKIDGFDIIGKTSTAQIYSNEINGYLNNEYIFSFGSIYPKENPEIVIFASVKRPSYGRSDAISKSFKEVTKNIAKYLNIYEENNEQEKKEYEINSYYNKDVLEVYNDLKSKNLDVYIIGNGNKIINQYPLNTTLVENDKVFLLTNSSSYNMPNLIEFSKNDVINYFNLINIDVEILNSGYVISQNIEQGKKIDKDTKIIVDLENKYIE